MTKDKKVIYLTSLISLAALLVALLTVKQNSRLVAAALMAIMAPATCLLIKRRSAKSIAKKDVLLLMVILSVITSALIEMTGIYFGFYLNPYLVNSNILLTTVIPVAVIIVATEIVRSVLLSQKNGFVNVVAFIIGVIAETLTFSSIAGITGFNQFMDLIGMTFLPAFTANILYHHVSKNYGALPNILYRLISTLYAYFIPVTCAMGDSIRAIIKLVLPLVVLALVSAMFSKTQKKAAVKGEKITAVGVLISFVIVASISMLVSCQFRFGALVIATESMTGEINKGDMIIYERYDGQKIEEGQVIVFQQEELKIVHRVVRIERINGQVRYYTKGDFNQDEDRGFRTESDIVGLTDVKISYVGYPTLWLRELVNPAN